MINYIRLSLFTTSLFLLACGTGKNLKVSQEEMREKAGKPVVQQDTLTCRYDATMRLSEDQDCGILIELYNGLMLQPMSLPDAEFTFKDGEKIRVSYDVMEDMTTPCLKAFAAAEITCLASDLNLTGTIGDECSDVIDIFSVQWMKNALNEMDARKITKAVFGEKIVYVYESPTATIIYDCYGKEICRNRPGQEDGCLEVRNNLENENVLLVVDY